MNSRMHVLVVEDQRLHFRCIEKCLESAGVVCDLVHYQEVGTALEYVAETTRNIDLVLLDLNLRETRGLATLERMREFNHLPIVVLSGESSPETVMAAARMGAQDYLIKSPMIQTQLKKVIHFAVSRQHALNDLKTNIDVLAQAAFLDPLTGVNNRRHLEIELKRLWGEADPDNPPTHSLMVIDLDHFGKVNNRYGHLAGDEVLRFVASKLVACTRHHDFVCRYGGEEFCIVIRDTSSAVAMSVAERMNEAISRLPVVFEDHLIPITASIGVTSGRPHEISCDDLFARADRNLYRVKQATRDAVGGDADFGGVDCTVVATEPSSPSQQSAQKQIARPSPATHAVTPTASRRAASLPPIQAIGK